MATPEAERPEPAQLGAVVSLVRDVLGDAVLGVVLHGSAVAGGLRPASDVDLLAVTTRPMSPGERAALLAGLLPLSGSTVGARPVELTVVVEDDVRPWRSSPVRDLQYGEWLRASVARGTPLRREVDPDLAVVLGGAREHGRSLHGPPPADLLDPVPVADVVAAGLAALPGLLVELDDDRRNVLLTLARIWVTTATGAVVAKDEAADWALPRLPRAVRAPLAHARDLYRGTSYAEERWTPELVVTALATATALADGARAATG